MRNGKTTRIRPFGAAIRQDHRGFTIVELLIVTAVIILLLSILVVALNAAGKASQKASTTVLMTSISKGLEQFKQDVGYYPPALDLFRGLVGSPDPTAIADDFAGVQNWYSNTSIAEYLIGYDEGRWDGYGEGPDSLNFGGERPPLGIRHPGPDGVWGASLATGALADRNPPTRPRGDVFGPYIELTDARLLGGISGFGGAGGGVSVFFPGDPAYNPDDPKVIVDYWGDPIRYYRLPYLAGAIDKAYRSYDPDRLPPTLANVVLLRPFRVAPGTETDVDVAFADANGDTTATIGLRAAEFALFSAGPDRAFDDTRRRDDDFGGFNEDNIVEIGP